MCLLRSNSLSMKRAPQGADTTPERTASVGAQQRKQRTLAAQACASTLVKRCLWRMLWPLVALAAIACATAAANDVQWKATLRADLLRRRSMYRAQTNAGPPCAAAEAFNTSAYACFVPARAAPRWIPQPGVRSESSTTFYLSSAEDWAACPLAAGEPGFKRTCNPEAPCAAPDVVILPQLTTSTGERAQDAVQRALRTAWGPTPPQIDLYVRAGCGATTELAQLLPSVELFWPEFIGEVIVALDAGNNRSLEHFLPSAWRRTRQSYRFVYEDVPCLPGRIFNQVSYLNLDRHSRAQYIVTTDSDTVLHSPVTPDVLFDEHGKLSILLPHTFTFQDYYWGGAVEFFTGAGTYASHTMVSQPVAFVRETFAAYRAWMRVRRGECYFDAVVNFFLETRKVITDGRGGKPSIEVTWFCWMCQLNTFLQLTGETALQAYIMIDIDDPSTKNPYQRYAVHTSYELIGLQHSQILVQGLCRALGDAVNSCSGVKYDEIDSVTFSYFGHFWSYNRHHEKLRAYTERFRAAERESRDLVGDKWS